MNLSRLRLLFMAGNDDDAIARELGSTAAEVRRTRWTLGLERDTGQRPPAPPVWARRLRKLHAQKKTTHEIAVALGCTYRTACQRLSDLGLRANKRRNANAPAWEVKVARPPRVPADWHSLLLEHGPCSCREFVRVLTTLGFQVNRDHLLEQLNEGVRQKTVRRHGDRGRFVAFSAIQALEGAA